jgi:hypothetical protein
MRRYYTLRKFWKILLCPAAHERKLVAQKHVLIWSFVCCSPNDAKDDERCCFVGCKFQGTFKLASAGPFLAIFRCHEWVFGSISVVFCHRFRFPVM